MNSPHTLTELIGMKLSDFADVVTRDTMPLYVDRILRESAESENAVRYVAGQALAPSRTHDMDEAEIRKLLDERRAALNKNKSHEPSMANAPSANWDIMLQKCVISGPDFLSLDIPDRPMIMSPWLKEGSLTMITAARGIGKTWFELCLLTAITHGLPIGNWKTMKPVPCLLVDGEMSVKDLQDRIKALFLGCGLPAPICPISVLSAEQTHQSGQPVPNLADSGFRDHLIEYLKKSNIKVVIFDNLASLTPGLDENSKQDYDPINQFFLSIRFLGISVIIVHHTGKNAGKTQNRGTSAHEDALDCSISLTRPSGYEPKDGCRFNVEFTKARGIAGNDLASFCFNLKEIAGVGNTWTTDSSVFGKIKNMVIALLGQGTTQADIARIMSMKKGNISKIKTQAEKDKWLEAVDNHHYKFTAEGQKEFGNIDTSAVLTI